MSLFATLSQGDIWTISGISFARYVTGYSPHSGANSLLEVYGRAPLLVDTAHSSNFLLTLSFLLYFLPLACTRIASRNVCSPINDILDKDEFTLEELLQEAELLQEVKARNNRLLDFLSQPSTIQQMISYVITPADEDADDVRRFKYPYMSCEVFCCEIASILQTFVDHEDGKLLSEFFTFLDVDGVIDSYLAGYFEKVLEMLLRHTTPVIQFLNDGGIPIFSQFLKHVDNYSIMQLVQRIMLPHIPFSMSAEADMSGPGREEPLCNWAFLEETCELLCIQMIESTNSDIPSHISDLFITVLQLSPAEAPILGHICQQSCLDRILVAAFHDNADTPNLFDPPSARACVSLAALSVVESILSRLCETAGIFADGSTEEQLDAEAIARLKMSTENLCAGIQNYFEDIAKQLDEYATKKPCGELVGQSKQPVSRLGHRGLQLVKLVESLVRLGHAELDRKLCESNVLKNTLELIFVYENNSMLHLSIQRIILMVIESDSSREALQKYVFIETGLLGRIIGGIRKQYPVSGAEGDTSETGETIMATSHPPTLGHFLNITQAINHTLQNLKAEEEAGESGAGVVDMDDGAQDGEEEGAAAAANGEGTEGEPKSSSDLDTSPIDTGAAGNEMDSQTKVPQNSLVALMQSEAVADEWNGFVGEILRPLEMRSTIDDTDEYSEKDIQAQEAEVDMDYAMQALGIQNPNQRSEDENPNWLENDQFHFDEAHDVDEEGNMDDGDDDDEEGGNKVTDAVGDSATDASSNQAENFADFSQMVTPDISNPAAGNFDPPAATFEANFDTDFADFPKVAEDQPTSDSSEAASTENNSDAAAEEAEDIFGKTPDPFQEGEDSEPAEGGDN